jgi:hypothetical protein
MAINEDSWRPVREYILEQGLCLPDMAKEVAELAVMMVGLDDYEGYEDSIMAFLSAPELKQQKEHAKQMWDW